MLTGIFGSFSFTLLIRLILACILGGLVGYERESTNQPAGFRTYILVCVASALVMCTSQYIFTIYQGLTTLDPARLGAQVISGIGFLGAGTIIRNGMNIKGLTTAASLWAVSCVGLAVGIGFYSGAIITTILIYITLIVLKQIESHVKKSTYNTFYIEINNQQMSHIHEVFEAHNVGIKNTEIIGNEQENYTVIKIIFKTINNQNKLSIISDLYKLEGIKKVYEEN